MKTLYILRPPHTLSVSRNLKTEIDAKVKEIEDAIDGRNEEGDSVPPIVVLHHGWQLEILAPRDTKDVSIVDLDRKIWNLATDAMEKASKRVSVGPSVGPTAPPTKD